MIINNLVKYEVDNITSNRSTSFKMNMCLYKQSLIGARPFNFQNSFPTFLFFYMNVNFLPSVTRDLMISKQQPLLTSERKYWLSRYLYHPNSTICFFLVRIFVRSRQQSEGIRLRHTPGERKETQGTVTLVLLNSVWTFTIFRHFFWQ